MILGRRSPGSWEGCRWSQQKGEQTLCRSRKVHGANNHLTSGVWSTRTIGLLWNCISARGHDGSVYGSASVTSSLPARSSCKSGCHGSRLQVAGTKGPGQEKRELSRRCNCRDENSAMRRSSSGWLIWRRRDERMLHRANLPCWTMWNTWQWTARVREPSDSRDFHCARIGQSSCACTRRTGYRDCMVMRRKNVRRM